MVKTYGKDKSFLEGKNVKIYALQRKMKKAQDIDNSDGEVNQENVRKSTWKNHIKEKVTS